MHITNQKLCIDIFMVGNVQNIFMEHDLYLISNDFWHTRKIDNFDPYNVLLAIATNIPVLFMTCSVVRGHILIKTLFIGLLADAHNAAPVSSFTVLVGIYLDLYVFVLCMSETSGVITV